MSENRMTKDEIERVLDDLNNLCLEEYGLELKQLQAVNTVELNARILRRLTGILLKRDFAYSKVRDPDTPSETNAARQWIWLKELLENPGDRENPRYKLLDKIRSELPRITGRPGDSWDDLIWEAENESGLFRVLCLYLHDKLNNEDVRTFKEYYNTPQTATVNVLGTASGIGLGMALSTALGPAGLAVPFLFLAVDYGLDRIFLENPQAAPQEPEAIS